MGKNPTLRFWISAVLLAAAYYFLLIELVGFASTLKWPNWWLDVFGSSQGAKDAWIIATYTLGVLAAAVPVALGALLNTRAFLMGMVASALAVAVAAYPSFRPDIWALIWANHPGYFFLDQLKMLVAVPLLVWLFRWLPSNRAWSGHER
ncbi:MAG TPA: hypothetical protein VGI91_06855 [Steroidobacteraceae bacterium]